MYPTKSTEEKCCWRCGDSAECEEDGSFWCTDCFVACCYSDPKLKDVKPGQTIVPPMVEYRSQNRYPVHTWGRLFRNEDPYARPQPWYEVVQSGYSDYFKNKGV